MWPRPVHIATHDWSKSKTSHLLPFVFSTDHMALRVHFRSRLGGGRAVATWLAREVLQLYGWRGWNPNPGGSKGWHNWRQQTRR